MKRIEKPNWKKALLFFIALAAFAGMLYYANYDKPGYYRTEDSGMEFEKVRVLEVLEDTTVIDETTEQVRRGDMVLVIEILTGRYKGDIVETTNYFSSLYNIYVTEGDKATIRIDTTGEGEYSASIYNYDRTGILVGFIIFFFILMGIVGGKKGLKSVLGLLFTVVCIVFLLLPLVLKGFSPIPTTIIILTISAVVCFVLLGGIQPKTIAAALGTISGVVAAAVFALIVGNFAKISGLNMDETESLLLIATDTQLKIRGLFISGVLIASLGVVMDVSMSISSAIEELHKNSPSMNQKALFQSGMNIGRDAMGTMANTLILALAGASLNMMLMMYSYGVTFTQLINTDFVAVELIRSIAGSLGIVFTVPASSLIAANIIGKKR